MKKYWFLIYLIIKFILILNLQLSAREFYQISDLGSSAHAIGLGNIEGFDDSAAVIFENPAGLYRVKNISVSGFYTSLFLDLLKYHSIAIGYKSPFGTIGIGFMHVGDSSIFHTEKSGDTVFIEEVFSYDNLIIKGAWQVCVSPNVYFGSTLSYFYHQLYKIKGNGINADLGFLFDGKEWDFSVSVKNALFFLPVFYSNHQEETPPLQIVLSTAKQLGDFKVFTQVKLHSLKLGYLKSLGVLYKPSFCRKLFYISGAWKEYAVLDKTRSNFVMGIGLDLGSFGIDFAYEPSEYFNQDQQYYISMHLNI